MTTRHVFGSGPFSSIGIRPLWPDSVHQLMMKAVRVSKAQSWPRPVVDNLVVCIRTGRSRSSFPIFSEEDLDAIVDEHGASLPGTPAFPPYHGVSRQSSVCSQISATNAGYTPQPMEGVLVGNSHNNPSLVPSSSASSGARSNESHTKVA